MEESIKRKINEWKNQLNDELMNGRINLTMN